MSLSVIKNIIKCEIEKLDGISYFNNEKEHFIYYASSIIDDLDNSNTQTKVTKSINNLFLKGLKPNQQILDLESAKGFMAACFMLYDSVKVTSNKSSHDFKFEYSSNMICKEYPYLLHVYEHDFLNSINQDNNIKVIKNNDNLNWRLLIFLSSILLYIFLFKKNIEHQLELLRIYFSKLDCVMVADDSISPIEIRESFSKFPSPLYKTFCFYMWKSGLISRDLYYKMVSNKERNDIDLFFELMANDSSRTFVTKYHHLFKMIGEFLLELNKKWSTILDVKKGVFHIERFYDQLFIKLPKADTFKALIIIVGIYEEVSKSNSFIPKECNELINENLSKEFFSFRYDNTLKKYKVWQKQYTNQTKHVVEIETRTGIQIHQSAASSVPENIQELNLNPVVNVDQLDEFIKYLAWRNYISEDDIESFKYIVFGGQRPSNFNKEMKFSITIEGAKPLLANILWRLKKDAPNQIIVVFGENVTQSNWSIGTRPASQRVFVDLCLFFPFLINKLKLKNNKNVEEVKNKLSTCVIELLHDNKDKPYSLRDIQNLEISKGEYWIVK